MALESVDLESASYSGSDLAQSYNMLQAWFLHPKDGVAVRNT